MHGIARWQRNNKPGQKRSDYKERKKYTNHDCHVKGYSWLLAVKRMLKILLKLVYNWDLTGVQWVDHKIAKSISKLYQRLRQSYTAEPPYIKAQGTVINTLIYPSFDISNSGSQEVKISV